AAQGWAAHEESGRGPRGRAARPRPPPLTGGTGCRGQTPVVQLLTGESLDTPVVELENLTVKLGRREILHGITCRLGVSGTGKAIGLLGPNGAGKSTLILTLLGFLRPSAGRARMLGLDCAHSLNDARSPLGHIRQNAS